MAEFNLGKSRLPFTPRISAGQTRADSRIDNIHTSALRVAKITNVDYESGLLDIVYLDGKGVNPKISLTSSYAGARSFLGAMPTIGDYVIVGFQKSGNMVVPYILQYLPRSYSSSLENDIMSPPQYLVDQGTYTPERFRMHKLYAGEIYALSKYGSEILLDKDIYLSNSKLVELYLNAADKSISLSSLNTYLNSAGIRVNSGFAYRNALLNDINYTFASGKPLFPIFYTEEGLPKYVPVFSSTVTDEFPYGKKSLDDDTLGFVEHRIEVKEIAHPLLDVTEANANAEIDSFYSPRPDGKSDKPLVIQVLGTLIGNDPFGDKNKYGKILKPKIFSDKYTEIGNLAEEACLTVDGKNEATSLAAAYTLKFSSGTAAYINKQGKFFLNLSASTSSDPIGAGESAEINTAGQIKVYLGKNNNFQRSLSMNTAGGVYTNWGADNVKSRSWEAVFRRGIYWNILGKDSDNNSYNMTAAGDVRYDIKGSRYTEVWGNDERTTHGTIIDNVLGNKVDNFINDKHSTYGGALSEKVMGVYAQTLTSGREVTIMGPNLTSGGTVADSTQIMMGSSEFKMMLGDRKETYLKGNHDTQIMAGNKTVKILMGDFTVNITKGDIVIKTTLGDITMDTKVGKVEINGQLGVTIKSAVKVKVMSPMVQIGNNPVQGGIVTDSPSGHKCYITGGPHIGSKTVTCNGI